MLTKSVKSVISVELKQVAKKSVQSVRSVSYNIIRIVSSASHNLIYAKVPAPCTFAFYELIIRELCSVGTSALCLHYPTLACTYLTLCLHYTCTCLHCLHSSYTASTLACTYTHEILRALLRITAKGGRKNFRSNRKFYHPMHSRRPGTTINTTSLRCAIMHLCNHAKHLCHQSNTCADRCVCKSNCYLHTRKP